MRSPLLLSGAVGLAAGLSAGFLIGKCVSKPSVAPTSVTKPSVAPQVGSDTFTDPLGKHPALRYGLPLGQNLRIFKQFVASFDSRTRNPQWVLEHVSRDSAVGEGDRKGSKFKEDTTIPTRLRNRLEDFKNSGYDRGHLAPAANHKCSQEALDETFSLSNISPQVGKGFNRSYWARFERFVRDLTKEYSDIYVVTGPLYLPTRTESGWTLVHPMIGQPPSMVAVPTHFFKIILAECTNMNGGTHQAVGAFVVPNMDIDPQIPLNTWIVPLEDLEAAAGLQVFGSYLTPTRRSRLAAAESELFAQLGRGRGPHILTSGSASVPSVVKGKKNMAIRNTSQAHRAELSHLCERSICEITTDDLQKTLQT
eukprot:CAMPEP_0198203348 /NCGR_PEP_ID=MMETSP1445-20131203/6615_1 /TAXON_ID=36898 /ORGANISM="Pyramimonas sp., Strain CCMP2087" /LENGTH=365 /DNA_ID=CAMNT_0043874695 /DNA_START=122 /DNA_END=1219 /DNA_ORIENTATION=+